MDGALGAGMRKEEMFDRQWAKAAQGKQGDKDGRRDGSSAVALKQPVTGLG